ncbi:hypothetical protein [Parasulfitobacter algicola]|uniref:Uncharacterized protein n=1 Tax=Parasulfitobacter algicola TaxID=2614809 RepID=A0ABX2IUX4_9RHOB|nr:hypothetical protein [Sulfitobacter algicola]NSX56712.1 hypothetical protein [Sulfitobacter algicola]
MKNDIKLLLLACCILFGISSKAILSDHQLLTGQQLRDEIIGHTFHATRGDQVVQVRFFDNGTVNLMTPQHIAANGKWSIRGNEICTTGLRKTDSDCATLERITQRVYRTSHGFLVSVVN